MTSPPLPTIDIDGFSFSPTAANGRVEAKLTGNADMRVMTELDAALEKLLLALPALAIKEVVFDIRELYFMNSSCFKCFVTFIVNVLDMPKPQQYQIVFFSNPKLHWQDRSLEALRSIATEIVRVRTT